MGPRAGGGRRAAVLTIVSQIFEALRRSRQQDRSDAGNKRTAHADALLATMGFASEKPKPRRRYAPALLVVLLALAGWLGWRWYSERPEPSIAERAPVVNRPAQPAAPPAEARPPAAQPAPPPVAAAPAPSELAPIASAEAPPVRSPVAAPRPQPTGGEADSLQLALQFHRAGDFDNALLQYRAVLLADERNPQAHNNLGLLYREKGLLDDAVRQFQRALVIDARYATARNNLGVALLGLGRVDEAASEFRQVLSQQPRNADAMVNLALAEKSADRPGAAMETLVRALAVEPRSAPAHYNLAILYEQAGERGKAVQHYRAFLEHAGSQHAARSPEVRGRLAELGGQ